MANKNQVTLTFAGDSKQLEKTFSQVGASGKKMSDDVGSASDKASTSFAKFGVAAAAATAVVGTALFSFAKDSVSSFIEAEQAQAKLADAFDRFPALADTNIGALQELNSELAKKTKFDDDATSSGQAVLAQFGLTGAQLKELTPLLQDFAAKTGKDLPDAAQVLGKALLGNTRSLKEVGINIGDAGKELEDAFGNWETAKERVDDLTAAHKQGTRAYAKAVSDLKETKTALDEANKSSDQAANVMAALRTQVGGFAEKEGQTAAGKAAILSNQFGELKETVGAKLLPVLIKVSEIGLKVVDWISQNQQVVGPLIGVIATVTAVQWAWNIAMAANPIGLIIIGIAALIAGIVWVATKTTWFQDIWNFVWNNAKESFNIVWGWLKGAWNWLAGAFNWFADTFRSIPDMISNAFSNLWSIITSPFRAAFNFISDIWNNTIGQLRWSVPSWIPGIGGNTISVPQLRKFHTGGVVPGSPGSEMLAVLQAGERVTPAGQSSGGGTTVNVYVDGVKAVQKYVKANGGVVQVALGR